MSQQKYFVVLLSANLILATFYLFIATPQKDLINFYTRPPIEISNQQHEILLRGAIVNEGSYSVAETQNLANLIQIAGGLTVDADLDFLSKMSQENLRELSVVVIPFKNNSKLLINYTNATTLAQFLNTTKENAETILSKVPYLTTDKLNKELDSLHLNPNESLIL